MFFSRIVLLLVFGSLSMAQALAQISAPAPLASPPIAPGPILIGDKPSADDISEIRHIASEVAGSNRVWFIRGYKVYWDIDESQIFDAYVYTRDDSPRIRRMTLVRVFPRPFMSRRASAKTFLTEHWGVYPEEKEMSLIVLPSPVDWKSVKKFEGDLNPIILSGDAPDDTLVDAIDFARANQEIKDRFPNYSKLPGAFPVPKLAGISAHSPMAVDITFRTGEENGFTVILEKNDAGWKLARYVEWVPAPNK